MKRTKQNQLKNKPHEGLKKLRYVLGKSQEQFAAMIGVSVDTIRSIETGRARLTEKVDTKIRLATGATFFESGPRVYDLGPGEVAPPRKELEPGKVGTVGRASLVLGPYSKQSFEAHRKNLPDSPEAGCEYLWERHGYVLPPGVQPPNPALECLQEVIPTLEKLFRAAGQPGRAGVVRRIYNLQSSLWDWVEEVNRLFKLDVELPED